MVFNWTHTGNQFTEQKLLYQSALDGFTDTLMNSGKFTANQLKEEIAKMEQVFKTHLSYKSISSDLESCLIDSMQDADVDFLIQYDLKMIPDTADNNAMFNKKFGNVDMCMRSVMHIKLMKLKQDRLI